MRRGQESGRVRRDVTALVPVHNAQCAELDKSDLSRAFHLEMGVLPAL